MGFLTISRIKRASCFVVSDSMFWLLLFKHMHLYVYGILQRSFRLIHDSRVCIEGNSEVVSRLAGI